MIEYAIKIVRFKQKKSLYTDVKDKASRSCPFLKEYPQPFSQLYEENDLSTFFIARWLYQAKSRCKLNLLQYPIISVFI